jgi:plastocyanin
MLSVVNLLPLAYLAPSYSFLLQSGSSGALAGITRGRLAWAGVEGRSRKMRDSNTNQGGLSSRTAKSVTISLTAENVAFDQKSITVPVGARVTIDFSNRDSGIPHNFALYRDVSAAESIFSGEIIIGPATARYEFTAPPVPGTYFFRCDIHPAMMYGDFIVR